MLLLYTWHNVIITLFNKTFYQYMTDVQFYSYTNAYPKISKQ